MVRNVCFTGGRFHNDCFPDVSFFFFHLCTPKSIGALGFFGYVCCFLFFVFFFLNCSILEGAEQF